MVEGLDLVRYLQRRLDEAEANVQELTRELERLQHAVRNQELLITEAKKRAEHYRAVLGEEKHRLGLDRVPAGDGPYVTTTSESATSPSTPSGDSSTSPLASDSGSEEDGGRLKRGIGARISELVVGWLPIGQEVALSEILKFVDSRFPQRIPPSTVRSALQRDERIRQSRKGYYKRVL